MLYRICVSAAVVCLAVFAGMVLAQDRDLPVGSVPRGPVETQEFILVDDAGDPRLAITFVNDEPAIIFLDRGQTLRDAKLNVAAGNTHQAVEVNH